jgi:hypothetical protein
MIYPPPSSLFSHGQQAQGAAPLPLILIYILFRHGHGRGGRTGWKGQSVGEACLPWCTQTSPQCFPRAAADAPLLSEGRACRRPKPPPARAGGAACAVARLEGSRLATSRQPHTTHHTHSTGSHHTTTSCYPLLLSSLPSLAVFVTLSMLFANGGYFRVGCWLSHSRPCRLLRLCGCSSSSSRLTLWGCGRS